MKIIKWPEYASRELCSLEANYKSHGRPKLWVSDTPTWIFGVSRHTRHLLWCATSLLWRTLDSLSELRGIGCVSSLVTVAYSSAIQPLKFSHEFVHKQAGWTCIRFIAPFSDCCRAQQTFTEFNKTKPGLTPPMNVNWWFWVEEAAVRSITELTTSESVESLSSCWSSWTTITPLHGRKSLGTGDMSPTFWVGTFLFSVPSTFCTK